MLVSLWLGPSLGLSLGLRAVCCSVCCSVCFSVWCSACHLVCRSACLSRKKNSDLKARIWFGSVAPSSIITLPHSLMVKLSLPKKSSFLKMRTCPMPLIFLSSRQILSLAKTADCTSSFGSVLLCLSR